MKSLCLNYMGSDGSNGIKAQENGGVWLYFHNINAPSQNMGSLSMAEEGFKNFSQAGLCSHIPTIHLSSGAKVSGTNFNDDSSSNSASTRSVGSSAGNYMSLMSGTSDIVNQRLQEQQTQRAEEREKLLASIEEQDKFTSESCVKTTTEACPDADESAISRYCSDPEGVERIGCEFAGEG